ncbi:MAG: prolyl oligopeptidase family serine peptidase, partial [Eubacteriales bacterium]
LEVAIAKAAEQGITLKKAAFTGASAGGHLAMMYAYKNQDISPLEIVFCASQCGPSNFTDPKFFKESIDTNGFYAVVSGLIDKTLNSTTFNDLTADLQAASPIFYIKKDSPPSIVAQGQKDYLVRYSQGTDIYDAFYEAGGVCELILYPNSDHGLSSDPDCSARYDKLFKEFELKYFGY